MRSKFFGNPGGPPAAAQQSRLKFSKAEAKKEGATEAEATSGASKTEENNGDANEDVKMEDAQTVKKKKMQANRSKTQFSLPVPQRSERRQKRKTQKSHLAVTPTNHHQRSHAHNLLRNLNKRRA